METLGPTLVSMGCGEQGRRCFEEELREGARKEYGLLCDPAHTHSIEIHYSNLTRLVDELGGDYSFLSEGIFPSEATKQIVERHYVRGHLRAAAELYCNKLPCSRYESPNTVAAIDCHLGIVHATYNDFAAFLREEPFSIPGLGAEEVKARLAHYRKPVFPTPLQESEGLDAAVPTNIIRPQDIVHASFYKNLMHG
ncbi:MAG: hypothetical protein PHS57_04235 [Alphaproteobacteria bacterium]|nr:hypothetical protein [Alphaproteobacteria bacterium]